VSEETKPAEPAAEVKPAATRVDETREIRTYEDALTYVDAALQSGGDAAVLMPLKTFFKNRIDRAPKPAAEPDEESIKKAQISRRTWKPYAAPSREVAAAQELKI
jgi:hypothetical protein